MGGFGAWVEVVLGMAIGTSVMLAQGARPYFSNEHKNVLSSQTTRPESHTMITWYELSW